MLDILDILSRQERQRYVCRAGRPQRRIRRLRCPPVRQYHFPLTHVWAKPLPSDEHAVLLINLSEEQQTVHVTLAELGVRETMFLFPLRKNH